MLDPAALVRSEQRLRAPLALDRPPVPNFELEPGRYYTRWGPIQALRVAMVTHAAPLLWVGLAGLSGYLGVCAFRLRVLTNVQMAMSFLLLCIATQIPIAVLGEGFFGLDLHLTCARLCLDLLLAILCYQLLKSTASWIRENYAPSMGGEAQIGDRFER